MDVEQKYIDMINQFKEQVFGMVTQGTNAMGELQKSAALNFQELQQEYVKGHQELVSQLNKANNDLITSYTNNYELLKGNLKDNYNGLVTQVKTNYDTNVGKFKEQCEDILKKVPILSAKIFQEAIASLQSAQNQALSGFEKMHSEMQVAFEKGYQENLKKLALNFMDGSPALKQAPAIVAQIQQAQGQAQGAPPAKIQAQTPAKGTTAPTRAPNQKN